MRRRRAERPHACGVARRAAVQAAPCTLAINCGAIGTLMACHVSSHWHACSIYRVHGQRPNVPFDVSDPPCPLCSLRLCA